MGDLVTWANNVTAVIVVLSVFGGLSTIAAITFLVLWLRERK